MEIWMNNLKFTKVRNVASPHRGTPNSAGIDFFVPEADASFMESIINLNKKSGTNWSLGLSEDGIILEKMERIFIPSGIKVSLPENTMLVAHNKGGVAGSRGIDHLAEVVDEDYEGEILVSVVNLSNSPLMIKYGSKLIQFVIEDIKYYGIEEITNECMKKEYERRNGIRKDGALGSTGT
jgi:dUTPase